MDDATIHKLAATVEDRLNQRITRQEAQKQINAALHRKSVRTVVGELKELVAAAEREQREQAVVITVLGLLCRDLDVAEPVAAAIQANQLEDAFFGGLMRFASGKDGRFAMQGAPLKAPYENAYRFVYQSFEYGHWDRVEFYESCRVLWMLSPERFEKLAPKDGTNGILLNMASGHLGVEPSPSLLRTLLAGEDVFRANVGMVMATRRIADDYERLLRCHMTDEERRKLCRKLDSALEQFYQLMAPCTDSRRAELMTNYLLTHAVGCPECFRRDLLCDTMQPLFAEQIMSEKVQHISDLALIARTVANTPALDADGKRISKQPARDAIYAVLQRFICRRTGIFGWDARQARNVEDVCRALSQSQRRKLRRLLEREAQGLMVNELDRYVRFSIYLKDSRQKEILEGIAQALAEEERS